MTQDETNPYSAPSALPDTTRDADVAATTRRLPIVSGMFFTIVLTLVTLVLTRLPEQANTEASDHVMSFTVFWTLILSSWVSTLIYRVLLLYSNPRPARGLAMLCGVIVAATGVAIATRNHRMPAAALLPSAVAVAAIATYGRHRMLMRKHA
ncbi:MAG: hypothetical protein KDA92_07960 [Planctomycetales bacterium]|nr:hypothetical protein [Planctomycetales bacterium]MCA9167203.1 hypothetical protein [Planctomycetales bacterium]